MTARVAVFFHEGLVTAPVAAGTRYATDSVGALKQPYMSSSIITASSSAQSSAAAPAKAQIAFVQVQQGKTVYFEINPPNRSTEASTSSPSMSGDETFVIGPGWSLSLMEAT